MNSNDTEMTKGCCTHCGGGIEFDASYVDHMITCPHCGRETVLQTASEEAAPPPKEPTFRPDLFAKRQEADRVWRAIAKWGLRALCVLIVLAVGYASTKVLSSGEIATVLVGIPGLLISVAVVVLALVLVILWIAFPVFVYRYLKRLVLAQERTNQLLVVILGKLNVDKKDRSVLSDAP